MRADFVLGICSTLLHQLCAALSTFTTAFSRPNRAPDDVSELLTLREKNKMVSQTSHTMMGRNKYSESWLQHNVSSRVSGTGADGCGGEHVKTGDDATQGWAQGMCHIGEERGPWRRIPVGRKQAKSSRQRQNNTKTPAKRFSVVEVKPSQLSPLSPRACSFHRYHLWWLDLYFKALLSYQASVGSDISLLSFNAVLAFGFTLTVKYLLI